MATDAYGKDYGSGLAQFTDGSTKHVLELGKKVHYFNPSATPLFTLLGRVGKRSTPVPKFEWMEDEHFLKRSTKVTWTSDPATSKLSMNRQAQMELIEIGNIYKVTVSDSGTCNTDYIIVEGHDGLEITCGMISNITDNVATFDATNVEFGNATGSAVLEFEGTADYKASSASAGDKWTIHGASQGYKEGADLQGMSSKKVRRLANYTQIFREPYQITRTARVSKQYGEQEYARLQARKLTQLKGNIEWALLTNGNSDADAGEEAPRRRFAGFGVGKAAGAGVIKSNDGRGAFVQADGAFMWDEGEGVDDLDRIIADLFIDQISGSMVKTVFCSNKWMKAMVKAVRASAGAQFEAGMGKDIKAGLRVSSYMGPVGQLDFVQHPYLNGAHENYALAVDFGNAEMRALSQSDVQLRKDVVKNGQDGVTDEWLYEGGPEIRNEQTHAILQLGD